MAAAFLFSFFILHSFFNAHASSIVNLDGAAFEETRETSLLDVFEVQAPLRTSYEGASCQQVIIQHDFANSYGSPYVGTYSPPQDCEFTTTIFNLSVTSYGINYDRLGLIFFGDVEIWRTSTAMPVRTGIYWDFQKEMTPFDTLLRSEQKVIMDMGNLHDSVFTGTFNVTVTALYYNDSTSLTAADLILPISSQASSENQSSVLSIPDQNATVAITFPRNVKRAVVSILASGNGGEEFWYSHVPREYSNTFNNSTLPTYSPFREVQLLIDGQLAGVSWPFPIIFTGGISPGLWVPIVGIDTYDLSSFEIDISPWLGLLCDGNSHSFELNVVGYDSDTILGTVGLNWWVTGSIFVWLDHEGTQTIGTAVQSFTPLPSFNVTPQITTSSNTNTSLYLQITSERNLSHTSTIITSAGPSVFTWTQNLTYRNTQNITANGGNFTLSQLTTGTSTFSPTAPSGQPITNSFTYPISFSQSYITPTDFTIENSTLVAALDRSLVSSSIPILSHLASPLISAPVPSVITTRQNGSCIYFWNDTYYQFAGAIDPAMGTIGGTDQWFSFTGMGDEGAMLGYGRHVKAVDGYEPVLVLDEKFGNAIVVPENGDLDEF